MATGAKEAKNEDVGSRASNRTSTLLGIAAAAFTLGWLARPSR
ncbi:hypothetical protein [Methylorubrum extorquens]|nr:hypothetical protein [Methylorubrum extorquens]